MLREEIEDMGNFATCKSSLHKFVVSKHSCRQSVSSKIPLLLPSVTNPSLPVLLDSHHHPTPSLSAADLARGKLGILSVILPPVLKCIHLIFPSLRPEDGVYSSSSSQPKPLSHPQTSSHVF